jgi:hypothetical protein
MRPLALSGRGTLLQPANRFERLRVEIDEADPDAGHDNDGQRIVTQYHRDAAASRLTVASSGGYVNQAGSEAGAKLPS